MNMNNTLTEGYSEHDIVPRNRDILLVITGFSYLDSNLIFSFCIFSHKCICDSSPGDETDDSQLSSAVNIYNTKENVLYDEKNCAQKLYSNIEKY